MRGNYPPKDVHHMSRTIFAPAFAALCLLVVLEVKTAEYRRRGSA